MTRLSEDVVDFFRKQNYVIVSSIDEKGGIHTACKGIVRVGFEGTVYLLDLYLRRTYHNLRRNPAIAVSAADEADFSGYALKGKARIISREEAGPEIAGEWEEKITSRISQRLVRNLRGEKGRDGHPEAKLPEPKYIIMMEVDEVIDLTPEHLK